MRCGTLRVRAMVGNYICDIKMAPSGFLIGFNSLFFVALHVISTSAFEALIEGDEGCICQMRGVLQSLGVKNVMVLRSYDREV